MGFEGEKFIAIPQKVWKDIFKRDPNFFQIYITHMGYFPKASYHYRERRKGCEDNIIMYCLQGKGHYILGDKRYEVVANQFIMLPATDKYMRYWADADDPWTIYWIHFTGRTINAFNKFLQTDNHKGPQTIPFNAKGIDIWQNIYSSLEMGYSTENLCNAMFGLYDFIASFLFNERHIAPEKNESSDIITLTVNHMRANIEKKLSVEDMARQHSLSSSYFSIIFRKATGMPPIDYFINLKMQKACQMLYSDEAKIKTVAMDLGYDDPYYFSRIFKKFMGMSPEQYRINTRK